MEKQYKKHFEEPLFKEACKVCTGCGRICECAEKDLAKSCKKMNEAIKKFNETCPENSKPTSGGACARIDKNGNLGAKIPNVCNVGYKFDGSVGKCVSHVDKK